MPKRKKLPPLPDYTGGGKNPEMHLIQKSNPLLSLSETNMTLPELKILDVYLDRIDSHDEKKRTVQFEKGEIEQLLGVTRILKNDLEKRLRNLAQSVRIEDDSKPKGFKMVSLFEEIDAWQDDNGLWQISLTCTNRAREYIFNVDNIGYLKYRLKNVINLTSRYSYVLYLWLENNRYRQSWEVKLTDLKALLRCNADAYSQFYRFNDLILKKCQKELNEKTDCRFTYEPIRRGRSVAFIKFTVETLPEVEPEKRPESISMESGDDLASWLSGVCTPVGKACEFTRNEMDAIARLVMTVPENKLPQDTTTYTGNYNFRVYDYLSICYAKMNREAEKKVIKNRFAYLCKIIRSDAGID